jgi:hypothetical protein
MLDVSLRDERQAWTMESDGSYKQRRPSGREGALETLGTHAWLIEATRRRTQAVQMTPGGA